VSKWARTCARVRKFSTCLGITVTDAARELGLGKGDVVEVKIRRLKDGAEASFEARLWRNGIKNPSLLITVPAAVRKAMKLEPGQWVEVLMRPLG